jgi:L-amino acid N-acyltransferase YncA
MAKALIRSATESDAKRIRDIYAPNILESAASFETEVPSIEDLARRIKEYQEKYPWLVYEIDGLAVGYAYASTHRSRCAYAWSCETSVYVDPTYQGRGIGRSLYQHLFSLLKVQGVVNIFVGIVQQNEGSLKLHEKLGFKPIGTFKDIGFKLGKWWSVDWLQLQLQKPAHPENLMTPNKHLKVTL